MTNGPRDPRVDELRQQLRSLGYLDAGVDRFLLAPARDRRTPRAVALASGARVGLLAGALLGPAAAIGLGARVPGLVTGARDAVVLAIYFAILFAAGAGLLASVTSLAASWSVRGAADRFTRRAQRVPRAAGSIVTVACLAYLTLWWRTANAGSGWSAPVWTIAALVLAVLISLLLGRAVRVTTLAVMAAAAEGRVLPPARGQSWRLLIAGGVVAFAGAAALLLWTAPADATAALDHPPLTVVSTGNRVRLIAIDGFDVALYARLAREGRVPRLEWIMRGERAPLAAEDTSDPARAWTTVATGVPPDAHGVHAIETRRVAGVRGIVAPGTGAVARLIAAGADAIRLTRPSVASREERRAKTLWEVAADAGLRTAVVNWWATWPAPSRSGIVVTDRAVLRLEHGGALDGEIAPDDVYARLHDRWPNIRDRAHAVAATAFPGAGTETQRLLRRSAELDATVIEMARALPGPARDLDVIYLPGLDIAQHALLATAEAGAAQSGVAERVEGLQSYYAFLDAAMAPLVEPQPHLIVMVVALPGRVTTPAEGVVVIAPEMVESVQGDVVIRPSAAEPQQVASILDLAPTAWHALGVPLSRELAGRPLVDLFGPSLRESPRYVTGYGRPFAAPPARSGQPLDQEMIDRLRSLGYVR